MADLDNLSIRISASTKTAVNNVNNLTNALKGLNAELDRLNPSRLNSVATAATSVKNVLSGMGAGVKNVKNVSQGLANIGQQFGKVLQTGDATKGLSDAMTDAAHSSDKSAQAIGNVVQKTEELSQATKSAGISTSTLKAGWNGFTSTLKKVGSFFKNITKNALSAAKSLGSFKRASSGAKSSASKLVKEITRIGKMMKLMLTRMVLRQIISGIGDGFKNLAQYSRTFDATLSMLWNDFRQLGNSIAAAVSPLLNALAPALHYIVQLAIQAANAINQLLSALTGLGSFTRAKKLTDSYAGSLDKANKSAGALKKTLLGFDEINQLQDNKSGGGGTSAADMFEDVPISEKWKDWAKKLKDMWAKADFTELGRELGEKLLEALRSIPWDKIKEYARRIGSSIATLINGFVEVEGLGYEIGKTLAEAFNTGFEFLNEFVHKLHWKSIGKFIADTFNGLFENIDWDLIYDTVITGFQGLADSIIEFILQFKWDNVSEAISNALNTLADAISEFFNRDMYDDRGFKLNGSWMSRLGMELGHQIQKSIKEGIEWEDIGRSIGDILQAAIDWTASFINEIEVQDVVDALTEMVNGFFEQVDMQQAGENIGEILQFIIDTIKGFWSENHEEISNQVGKFFKGLFSKIDKSDIGRIIGSVFDAAITIGIGKLGLSALKSALASKIVALFSGESAAAATTAGASIASSVVAGITTFLAGLEVGKLAGLLITKLFGGDASIYLEYLGPITGTIRMIKDGFIASIDAIEMAWSDFWQHVTSKAKENFNTIGIDIDAFIKKIKSFFSSDNWYFGGVAEGLKKTFQKAKEGIAEIWNSIANKLNGEHGIGLGSFRIHLPTFAGGGFPEDGLFMANHGEMVGKFSNGKTAVANNEQITNGIAQAVYAAISSANASGGREQYINNTIYIDDVAIARAVTKGQDKLNRRYSPTMA